MLDVGECVLAVWFPGLDVDRPRGVNPFAAGAGYRHQRVWDIDQGLIATEAIREPMEQAAETLRIVEGFCQPPQACLRSWAAAPRRAPFNPPPSVAPQ